MASSGSILGNPVLRREDPGILTGGTQYFDDLDIEGLLHVAFVRSTIAHATIEAIDTERRRRCRAWSPSTPRRPRPARPPRLHDAAADDEPAAARARQGPLRRRHRRDGRRRDQGAGGRRGRGRDRRLRPAPGRSPTWRPRSPPTPRCPRGRTVRTSPTRWEPVRSRACSTTPTSSSRSGSSTSASPRCRWSRTASSRCRASPPAGMTLWVVVAGPARCARRARAGARPRSRARARRAAPRSAAASAPKQGVYVEYLLVAKAALVLGRPVKWTETRSENMVAMWHGRGQVHYVELGLKRDGTITGLRVRTVADAGAYPAVGAFLPFFTQMMAQQRVRRSPKIEFNWQAAVTNTTPVARVPRCGPSRGDPPRRAHARHRRRRARHRSGRDPAQELHPARGVPVHDGHRLARPTTPASTTRRSTRCSSTPATTSCAPSRPRAASAATRSCSASASRRTSRSPRRSACTASSGRSRSRTTAR